MTAWQDNIDLAPLTTFGVPARGRYYVEAHTADEAIAAVQQAESREVPVLVLGGGSNMLFTRDFPGLVLRMGQRGIRYQTQGERVLVTAAAGEPWHGLVLDTLQHGAYGLENLSLIPGTVGAAPMQNIGAYGVEIKDVFHSLQAWDREHHCRVTLTLESCDFAYRDSLFKRNPGRYLILEVTFDLSTLARPRLAYGDIARELEAQGVRQPTPQQVSESVIAIRSRKLPDPALLGNAGSFFKNPIVDAAVAARLLTLHAAAPHWALPDGRVKLAAGWLIEQCGWKGRALGRAAVYDKQALVLVNRGGASGAEVRDLALAVRADVEQRFGVQLEAEPLIL